LVLFITSYFIMFISKNRNKILLPILIIVLFYALFIIYSNVEQITTTFQQIELFYLVPIFGLLFLQVF
jgi:hypothetical protein